MNRPSSDPRAPGLVARLLRLTVGLLLLAGFIGTLAAIPPMGAVLRHNSEADIQATALFYMDLDRMPDLERNLERMVEEQETTAD